MPDYLSSILQWINAHPELAGIATFIISAVESIAIIGTIIPGSIMMTAIGALAGSGVMPLWSTIIWAILGAIVGDGISYWIGYYFKDNLHYVWPFRAYPSLLASGEKFFKKHGGKSVFIGRFVGPVRALVPLVAGMLRMKPLRFTIFNVLSAIGWAPAYMLPGIALGAASLELPPDIAVHAMLMLLLIGLFIIFCGWLVRKLLQLISAQINYGLTKLWHRLQMSRYFYLITIALKHHDVRKTYGQLILAFYLILISIAFVYITLHVYIHGSPYIFINNMMFHFFRSMRSPTVDTVMMLITLAGESKVILPVLIAIAMWLGYKKRWHTALHVLALGLLTTLSVDVLKHVIHSPRPWGIQQSPSGFSYPSGHSTFSLVFYIGLALLLTQKSGVICRRFFYLLSSLFILAVGVSRIYLGAHWFTDVCGGYLLGTMLLMLIVLSYNRKTDKFLSHYGIIVTTLLAFALSYGSYVYLTFDALKKHSQQRAWPTYTVSVDAWWNRQGPHLPLYRLNRFGFANQILSLQWIGNLADINRILLANNWEVPEDRNWITVLHRVSNVESTEHVPLVLPLYLNSEPVLIFSKHANDNKKLIVLRLWAAPVTLKNNPQPLWVGTVELIPSTYSWLLKPHHNNDINLTIKELFTNPPSAYDVKTVTVTNTHRRHPQAQTIILIKPKNIH